MKRREMFTATAGPLLAALVLLCTPAAGLGQEGEYRTVTGRLHPDVEIRVQLESDTRGNQWFVGGVGGISVPLGAGNLVLCTAVQLPELDPEAGSSFMAPLRRVARLEVRHPGAQEWVPLDLVPLLEAEPAECRRL